MWVDVAVAVAVADAVALTDADADADGEGLGAEDTDADAEGLVAGEVVTDPVPDADELGEGETLTVALGETVATELRLAVLVGAGPSWQ